MFSSALSKKRSGLFILLTQIISWAIWIAVEIIIMYAKRKDWDDNGRINNLTLVISIGNALVFFFIGYVVLIKILYFTLFLHVPKFEQAMGLLLMGIIGVEGCIGMMKLRKLGI